MKKYKLTSNVAFMAVMTLFIAFRIMGFFVSQYIGSQWEMFGYGILNLVYCGLSDVFYWGGHGTEKTEHNKEPEGYAWNIPILTLSLSLFLVGMLTSTLANDWVGMWSNFILLLVPIIFITRVLIVMACYHGALNHTPSNISLVSSGKYDLLFGNILLQTILSSVLLVIALIFFHAINLGPGI